MKQAGSKVRAVNAIGNAIKKNKNAEEESEGTSDGDDDAFGPGKKSMEEKASNTIMQQINSFSLTPMNDNLAE